MKKIDFYLLSEAGKPALFLFACKLVTTAYNRGHQVFIYCQNEHDAHEIDELLWTFDPVSFIPHNLQGEGPNTPPAVQIGFADHAKDYYDILINLSDHVPEFFQQFNRTCEIVSNEEQYKLHKRKNFLFYKQKNLQIITHEISNSSSAPN